MGRYTNRKLLWETLASWWVLLVFVPFGFTSFIAFLYAGIRAGNRRWRWYALLYLIFGFIIPFAILGETQSNWGILLFVVVWGISIVSAVRIRPTFLVMIEMRHENRHNQRRTDMTRLRQEVAAHLQKEKLGRNAPPVREQRSDPLEWFEQNKQTETTKQYTDSFTNPTYPADDPSINVNTATETELASIPEIGIILAKKIVIKRSEIGDFRSLQHFAEEMNVRAHVVERLQSKVNFTESAVDTTKRKQGRMIDF